MATNKFTYQCQNSVSIPRVALLRLSCDDHLSKKDYKVLLTLLSSLEGWNGEETTGKDPENFKAIKTSQIAIATGLKKKDVVESMEKLVNLDYLRKGSNDTVSKGYRFTF